MNKTIEKGSSRIEWIDLAKGICILIVVLYHIEYDFFEKAISVALPLFFMISGLFYRQNESFAKFFINKTNKLLVPFLFFMISTSILPHAIINHESSLPIFFTYHEVIYNLPLWFLLCLYNISIIFYFVHRLISRLSLKSQYVVILLVSFLLGVMGMELGVLKIKLPFYLDTALSALPFYAFGWWLNSHTIFLKSPSSKWDILVIILCALSVCYFVLPIGWLYNAFYTESLWVAYPCGILGSLLIFLITKHIKRIPLLSYWGRNTIIILCTHFPLITFLAPLLGRWLSGVSFFILTSLITLAVCHFLIPFMQRFFPHFIGKKDLIKVH